VEQWRIDVAFIVQSFHTLLSAIVLKMDASAAAMQDIHALTITLVSLATMSFIRTGASALVCAAVDVRSTNADSTGPVRLFDGLVALPASCKCYEGMTMAADMGAALTLLSVPRGKSDAEAIVDQLSNHTCMSAATTAPLHVACSTNPQKHVTTPSHTTSSSAAAMRIFVLQSLRMPQAAVMEQIVRRYEILPTSMAATQQQGSVTRGGENVEVDSSSSTPAPMAEQRLPGAVTEQPYCTFTATDVFPPVTVDEEEQRNCLLQIARKRGW
jgi:hypothetical protein